MNVTVKPTKMWVTFPGTYLPITIWNGVAEDGTELSLFVVGIATDITTQTDKFTEEMKKSGYTLTMLDNDNDLN